MKLSKMQKQKMLQRRSENGEGENKVASKREKVGKKGPKTATGNAVTAAVTGTRGTGTRVPTTATTATTTTTETKTSSRKKTFNPEMNLHELSESEQEDDEEQELLEPIRVYNNPERINQLLNPQDAKYDMLQSTIRPSCASNDDLLLEKSFQTQAEQAVLNQLAIFKKQKYSWQRPADYFAENIKPDSQMSKIVADINSQPVKTIRIKKDSQKVSKPTPTLSDISVEKDKKMKPWKKEKKKVEMEKSGKRMGKDKKYGFGGGKRFSKSNDAASTSDFKAKRFKKGEKTTSRGKGVGKKRGRK